MISIELTGTEAMIRGLQDAPARVQHQVATLLEKTAHVIQRKAYQLAPVGKYLGGRLRQSIQVHVISRDPVHIEVGPNVSYAKYIEFGRGWVFPVYKKALRWETRGGKAVFARWARPAAAQPFMRPAINAGLGRMALQLNEVMEKAFGK